MNELDTIKQAAKKITESQRRAGYVSTGLYLYKDIEGSILYVRLRMDHPNGDKWIRPLSCNSAGEWTELKEPQFPDGKPLYNLHLLVKNPDKAVFIVEGEKCADALIKLGLLAITSGGASSASAADWQPLTGRETVIFPDNDPAGLQYAIDVTAKLTSLNATIKQIDISLLNLPAKGDCVDWLAQFKTIHGRDATSADIQALPQKNDLIESPKSDYLQTGDTYPLVSIVCANSITPEAIQWLWDGYLARGKFHILAGQAGTGKTTLALNLAATVSIGGHFADGTKCEPANVLIWSGEDGIQDTLIPRLIASGANLDKIHFISEVTQNNEKRGFDPANDVQSLIIATGNLNNIALLIVDPIVNAVAGDSHKNGEVRRALAPLVEFGQRMNCAILGVSHFSKGTSGREPLERVTGSLAFGALARVVLATAKITEGEASKRIFCRAKSNIGLDGGGFEYEIQQTELKEHADIFTSYAIFGEAIEGTARELLAEPDNRDTGENGNSALEDAKYFLLELLADGELAQKQIEADAKGANHSWATVRRAKSKLNIISSKSKLDNRWYWKLPSNMLKNLEHAQDVHINNVSTLSTLPKFEHISPEKLVYDNEIARF